MIAAALLLAAQSATTPVDAPPRRIDLLARPCPAPAGGEVVVCATADGSRLPLPVELEPGAVVRHPGEAASDDPGGCVAVQQGCAVGVDLFGMATAAVRLVGKAINPNSCCDEPGQATNPGLLLRDAARALRKKPDKSNRVAIDLSAPPPSTAGRLSP